MIFSLLVATVGSFGGDPALIAAALAVVCVGMAATKIEWAENVWNPTTGCTRVSEGCDLCYMFAEVENRLQHRVGAKYTHGTAVTLHPGSLADMERVTVPSKVFVNSMSDLFHEAIPDEYVFEVFEAMAAAPWHLYMILTKRATRLRELGPSLPWGDHVMMGVSVEDASQVSRIADLRECGARRTFVSFEPLLGSVADSDGQIDLAGIDYAIAGGESKKFVNDDTRNPVALDGDWVRELRDACAAQRVAFHFKQWGAHDEHGDLVGTKKAGRTLDGRKHDEEPDWYGPFMRRAALLAAAARVGGVQQATT